MLAKLKGAGWVAALVVVALSAAVQAQAPPAAVRAEVTAVGAAPDADISLPSGNPVLSLRRAVEIALERNPLRKAALADEKIAAAEVRSARSALLPHFAFNETATRGNDPVYAFGTRLRQGRFAQGDFALNRLNYPQPIGNFSTRFTGQWNLFDSFASWANVRRAETLRNAAAQQLTRTDQETVFRVISAYYALLLAHKQMEVAAGTTRTADAILKSTKARYNSGLVVESDYLASQVNSAARQQELIRATNHVALARAQLTNALGVTTDATYEPAATLTQRTLPQAALEEAEKQALENRPDLKQIHLQESAQKQGVHAAQMAFGPRLNAFASWGFENPTLFAGGGGNNWVSGIELQLDIFSGGAKTAQLAREKAMQEKMAALREAAVNSVRLDVRRAWYDADAARKQVAVAHASITQSQETLRISHNRYGAGLTTITDLLRAEDAARRSQTDYWQAVYDYEVAHANLQLATGTLNANSPAVSQ